MNVKIALTGVMFSMLAIPQLVVADDFSTAVKISTLGPGLEVEQRVGDNFGLRLGANYLPLSVSVSTDDVDYDADFSWQTVSAMADIYPFGGIFRITGGILYNGNDVDVSGSPSENVKIGNHTYTPGQVGTISGSLGFNSIAPYAGSTICWNWLERWRYQQRQLDGQLRFRCDVPGVCLG